jgi:SNF2 family DNA or RNA helicase
MKRTELLEELKSIGKFSNYQLLKKQILNDILQKFKKTGKIDVKYLKKSKVGEPCESSVECTTQLCEDNECVSNPNKVKTKTKSNVMMSKMLPKKQIVKNGTIVKPQFCLELPNEKKVNPHQRIVAEFMRDTQQKGLVVVHKVGSGKTLTGLVSAQCLLSLKDKLEVVVLTPKSVVEQFNNELNELNLSSTISSRINVYPHATWLRRFEEGFESAENKVLIVDEAHKFKGANKINKNTGKESSKYARLLSEAAKKSFKIILLTATPLENNIKETMNYVSIVNGRNLREEYKKYRSLFKVKTKILGDFSDYLKCNFSVYDQIQKEHFPRRVEHFVKLKMTKEYNDKYLLAELNVSDPSIDKLFYNKKKKKIPNLMKFHNGIRRAVNNISITSPKITWTVDKVKEIVANKGKIVIYSTWLKFGIDLIAEKLRKLGIDYAIVSGAATKEDRMNIVKNYNDNKVPVMLITSAGAEGLDLKETSAIVILEPFWHQSRIEQVIGRGVRYKSHANLPEDKRYVDIYHLLLEKNEGHYNELSGMKPSADTLLYEMSKSKMNHIEQMMEHIKANSIENQKCL